MDDASWNFFCNNSPRLVVKSRPKTPISLLEKHKEPEMPKLLSSNDIRQKMFKKPPELIKNSFRIIYREQTPPPLMKKIQSRALLKPSKILASSFLKDSSKGRLSPLIGSRPQGTSMKKLPFKTRKN